FARDAVTVALSGDGGDEMFGGYGRYFATLDDDTARHQSASTTWRAGQAYYSDRILVSTEPHIEELFAEVPERLTQHLTPLLQQVSRDDVPLICRLRKTDVENYMPGAVLAKVDRMSMRHSLEVRTPFLNVQLARFAERLPQSVLCKRGRGKLLLRELAYRYLPRDLVDAPKRGFGIPMSKWGKAPLLEVARKLLDTDDSKLRQAFGPEAIERFLQRQRSESGFSTYQVWALAMLESWARYHPAHLPELHASHARRRSYVAQNRQSEQVRLRPQLFLWPVAPTLFAVLESEALRLDGF